MKSHFQNLQSAADAKLANIQSDYDLLAKKYHILSDNFQHLSEKIGNQTPLPSMTPQENYEKKLEAFVRTHNEKFNNLLVEKLNLEDALSELKEELAQKTQKKAQKSGKGN